MFRCTFGWSGESGCVDAAPNCALSMMAVSALLTIALTTSVRGQAPAQPPDRIVAHSAPINSAVFVRGGSYIATCSADQTIKIWNASSGELLRSFSDHTEQVLALAASPDGRFLVSGAADNTLRLWDVPQPDPLMGFAGHSGSVNDLALSPEGLLLVSAGDDQTVRLWDTQNGGLLKDLQGHTAAVLRTAVRGDNILVASGDAEGIIRLWSPVDFQPRGSIESHAGQITGLAFRTNNQQVVSAGEDGLLKLWQLPVVEPADIEGHVGDVRAVAANGQYAVTADSDTIRVLSLSSRAVEHEFAGQPGVVESLAVSPNNTLLASSSSAGMVRIWNLADGTDRFRMGGHQGAVGAVAFHPDNVQLASAGLDGTIRLWELPPAPTPLAGHAADVFALAVSSDRTMIATGSADRSVRLWNSTTGQGLRALDGHDQPVHCLAFSGQGNVLASGDAGGQIYLWNPADGAVLSSLGAHTTTVTAAVFDPSGQMLATAGADGLLKFWRLPAPPPKVLTGNPDSVTHVAISKDGKLVVTAGADKMVRIFDAVAGTQVQAVERGWGAIAALGIHHGTSQLAIGDDAGSVTIFALAADPAQPQPASRLAGHVGPVRDVAFGPNGKRIASAGEDGTVRIWKLPVPPTLLEGVESSVTKAVVSGDGKWAAVAGQLEGRPAIFVWNVAAGEVVTELLGHTAAINAIAFSSDSSTLVSGAADNTVRIWDLKQTKFAEVKKLEHPAAVTAVALTADGGQVFTGGADNTIRQWSVADSAEVRSIAGHTGAVTALQVSGTNLVSGSADSKVRIWSIASGAAVRTINHGSAVTALATSGDGTIIASGGADQTVKLWSVADGSAAASLAGHAGPITGIVFDRDANRLASSSSDGVRIWDTLGRQLEHFAAEQPAATAVGFAAGAGATDVSDQIVACAATNSVRVFTPSLLALVAGHEGDVGGVAFAPDGNAILSGGADKSVRLWNSADGTAIRAFAGAEGAIQSVAVTADGTRAVAGSADNTLRIWNLSDGTLERVFEHSAAVRDVACSAVGNRVAGCGDDSMIRVWDLADGKELERFAGHEAPALSVTFADDGETLVSGGADKTARVWTLSVAQAVVADAGEVRAVAVLPDGSQFVTAGSDQTVKFWNRDGNEVRRLEGAQGALSSLVLRPDAQQLAALDTSGRVYLWNLADSQMVTVDPPMLAADPNTDPPANAGSSPGVGSVQYAVDGTRLLAAHGNWIEELDTDGGVREIVFESTAVTAAAFAADERTIVVGKQGDADNAVLRTLPLQRLIAANTGGVSGVAFTADGNGLVSGGVDGKVKLWNVTDGSPAREYAASDAAVTAVAVTGDGTRVVAAGLDNNLLVWPLIPPAPPDDSPPPPGAVSGNLVQPEYTLPQPAATRDVAVSADGLKLATCADDNVVRVWDIAAGKQLEQFTGVKPGLAVAFAGDNRTLVCGGAEGSARFYTLSTTRLITAHERSVTGMALLADGTQVATASDDGTVKLWSLDSGQLVREFSGGEAGYASVAARADNAQLAAVSTDSTLYCWNVADGAVTMSLKVPAVVHCLRYSEDNQKLVAACEDNTIRCYNPADGSLLDQTELDQPVRAAAFTHDNASIFTAGGEGALQLWGYAAPQAVRTFTGHGDDVYSVAYSADGKRIASASKDQTVRLWDAESGTQLKQFTGHQGSVYGVAISPDGALVVSCGADGTIRLWDVISGQQLKQILASDKGVYSICFDPSGRRVAATGLDKVVRIYDAFTGALQTSLEGHDDFVYRVAFNSRGDRLLSCGYGGNVLVWNPAGGQTLFSTRVGRVANNADLSPEGARVAVAGGDGELHLLDLPAAAR